MDFFVDVGAHDGVDLNNTLFLKLLIIGEV
jgi:hypothetical protein